MMFVWWGFSEARPPPVCILLGVGVLVRWSSEAFCKEIWEWGGEPRLVRQLSKLSVVALC